MHCILQLHLDCNNLHGRFEPDNTEGIRSRVWRIGTSPRFFGGRWQNWGNVLEPGSSFERFSIDRPDPLFLHGLQKEDRLYILVIVSNRPPDAEISLTAIFSQSDKSAPKDGHCGSPFLYNDELHHHKCLVSCPASSTPHIRTLSGQDSIEGWYLGWGPDRDHDRLKINSGFTGINRFSFSVVAQLSYTHNNQAKRRDFSFDPQLDVGGGDGGRG